MAIRLFHKYFKALLIFVLVALSVGACQPAATEAPAAPAEPAAPAAPAEPAATVAPAATEAPAAPAQPEPVKKKVALLLPGLITDQSWSQFGYEGAKGKTDELGYELAYTENVAQAEQAEIFRNYAKQDFDIIIGHGGQFVDAAKTVAAEFPDLQFVVTNSTIAQGNLSGTVADYYQIGYMAGAIGCHMTKTNKIGAVVGQKPPHFEPAWDTMPLGAKSCGKDVTVTFSITGDYADANKAREAALAMIADGADVLFGMTNQAAAGMFSAAEDKGVFTIGLHGDQSAMSPTTVVASIDEHPAGLTAEAASGTMEPGTLRYVTFGNGMDVYYTSLIPDDTLAELKKIQQDLADGKIDLGK